jgi:hypothetical protein
MASWSEAFAAQARSECDAYYLLAGSVLPTSHRLHYLQMWLEKLCKACLWMPEASSDELRTRHNLIAKVLPSLISRYWRRIGFGEPPDMAQIRQLCREIDLLHPQVDDNGRRPDNVEYPWTGISGGVEVPAQWKFPLAGRLYQDAGRLLLKAADLLTRDPTAFIPGR